MAKEKRTKWLNKISRWILDALPSGRSASGQKPQELASQQTPTRSRPKPTSTESSAPPRLEAPAPQWLEPQQPDPSRPEETIAPQAPRAALAESSVKTINQAWKAFELAWTAADLSDHYFLEGEELHQTLAVLDRSFEEELIEWLFQLCTKPDALKDLAGIIERGQVKPTDNIDAIRAFAYVSVAVSSRPRQPPAAPPLVEEQAKPQPDAIRALTPSPNFVPELSPDGLNEEATAGVGNIPLEVLELSIRSFNCLKRAGIHTLLDLAGKTEESLLQIKNFGQKSVDEVLDAVERRGLTIPFRREDILGTDDPGDSKTTQGSDSTQTEEDELRTLGLSARALNGLYRGKIYFISQLIAQSESDLLAIQNLGPTVIAEIKAALQHRGLALVAERDTWPEEAATLLVGQQALQDLEEAWQQLRQQVDQEIDQPNPAIETLLEFCANTTTDPASRHLSEILGRLKSSLDFIADTLTEHYSAQSSAIKYSIEAVQTRIASQLLQHTSEGATQRVHRITKSFSLDQERNWLVYLLRCNSQSLTSIGSEQEPALSRDQVRLMETKISNVVGIKPADIVEQAKQLLMEQESKVEKQVLEGWLARLDRLPTQADQREEDIEQSQLWDQVCEMDLKNRSALLSKHQLPITGKEYDYHYQYVVQQISAVGTGYWREFENLKQFVLRHAIALGEPELMPKQTSFPRAVGGIVTSHGGQGKVAKRIGLKYQGQLVGSDGGRRYWTDDRLIQLLADINNHYQIDIDVMPSYGEVLEFFAATEMGEYQDKKPHSAVAAFTKMGTLHWSEVAQRFDKRFISGESQKNVTLSYIKAFVRDIGEHLNSLTPSELFVLFQAQGINRADKEKFSRTFDALVDAVQSGMVNKDDLRSWADNNQVESVEQLLELGAELKGESSVADKEQKLLEHRSKQLMDEFPEPGGVMQVSAADLPTLEPANVLRALDKAGELIDNSATDGDKVEFLKAKATAKLWDACFQDEQRLIDKLRAFLAEQDSYSEEVQQAFLDEYAGARALPIPTVYAFKDLKGIARDPKLMQRLVAFRLQRDLRLLNLSGTGTGKTLSAIYSAQICDCQRILISCPNGVIESWRRAFESAFPTANLIIRPEGWSMDDIREGVNVVLVNHERFQDRFAQQLLGFCVSYQADMIVVDEIHQSKRRSADTSSQRRKLLNEYIRISSNINPSLRVLGLSATPVINNLYEGRSLLELICQESFDDVDDKVDLNSCMNLYQHFIVHGIRMNPGQLPRTTLIHHEVDATALLPEVVRATKRGNYHDIEQLLVQPKLECLGACLERGEKTIIFITYIKNTLTPITRWLSANSFSYSVFTGDEKDAQEEGFKDSLEEFIHGSTQVLVASVQCAGTGVDGLQSVCSRAIFFQLPWTSTEFEQAVGRLDRDGTNFDSVVVHIPITDISLPDGQRWSWCRSKLDRLESKRDIAKAAVDGEFPDAATLISPGEASKYWINWLEKLDRQAAEVSIQSTQP